MIFLWFLQNGRSRIKRIKRRSELSGVNCTEFLGVDTVTFCNERFDEFDKFSVRVENDWNAFKKRFIVQC